MRVILRIGAPGHEERIGELTRVEVQEGAGGGHGQPHGDREAIGDGLALKYVTEHMQVAGCRRFYVR